MQRHRLVCTCLVVSGLLGESWTAMAQAPAESSQELHQEIDQLKQEFEVLKQQYGERLAALEAKVAATEKPSATVQPLVLTSVETPAPQQTPARQQPTGQVPAGVAPLVSVLAATLVRLRQ